MGTKFRNDKITCILPTLCVYVSLYSRKKNSVYFFVLFCAVRCDTVMYVNEQNALFKLMF